MGIILLASCKCGFKQQFLAGGGMANFQTFCGVPGVCGTCNKFILQNYLGEDKSCQDCGTSITFYNDPSLQVSLPAKGSKPGGIIFEWNTPAGSFTLPDTRYFCPNCGKFNLTFKNAGNWD